MAGRYCGAWPPTAACSQVIVRAGLVTAAAAVRRASLIALVLLAAGPLLAQPELYNALPNAGLEAGEQDWAISDDTSQFTAEAAHNGRQGLRLGTLEYNPNGASVLSSALPVTPGQELTLTFWCRTQASCSGVFLWYYGADHKLVSAPAQKATGGQTVCVPDKLDGAWHQYTFKATVPPRATTVALWLHSWAAMVGTADYDDFAFTGFAPGVTATPPPPGRKPRPLVVPGNLPARQSPLIVILKLDDFKLNRGQVPPVWRQVADLCAARGLKAGFGVIAGSLRDATPEAVQWMQEQRASGRIEFWFHGWDHATHEVEGQQQAAEFSRRSYEEQRQRFADSQKLAQEKLGFAFQTFGPPGGGTTGSFDPATLRAVAQEPEMRVVLYPQPLDDAARQLEGEGRVRVWDRVWLANLEAQVGVPYCKALQVGIASNPQRPYFVLQGHPPMWSGARWDEFLRIIDYLVGQKAVFMTPVGYLDSQRTAP